MNSLRILAVLFALSLLPGATAAAGGKAEKAATKTPAPEWAEQFGNMPLAGIWRTASEALAKIETAISAQRLDGIAEWAETVHLAAHALEERVTLEDAERAKRLKGALRTAAKIGDDVIDAAGHKNADQAAEAVRRLTSAWKLATSRLPQEIVHGGAQK